MLNQIMGRVWEYRKRRYWDRMRQRGLRLGKNVNLPPTTWIDPAHAFLISIGDNCGFGADCAILAHDALANEYMNATRIAKVVIHESCHIGMRSLILPGVTIGPRSVVGAGSIVATDIPPDSLAAGQPARVLCSLEEYLDRHRKRMKDAPVFPYEKYGSEFLTPERLKEMVDRLGDGPGYIVGGKAALEDEQAPMPRTR